jgi:acetyltransferase-like isoleucine patch superfamily enzyme
MILDRPLVRIGSRVIFGMSVRLNPHVIAPFDDGRVGLHIGHVTIGDDALVGGYSLLLPGSRIEAGAITKPFRSVRAGSRDG